MSAERIKLHRLGVQHLNEGKFDEAIDVLQTAQREFGEYIGIQCDLAATYYVKGDFSTVSKLVKNIEFTLDKYCLELDPKSKVNTLIFLSKMHEEEGRIDHALTDLKLALQLTSDYRKQYIRTLCQIVRLAATFQIKMETGIYYRALLQELEISDMVDIEIDHALMLAEGALFGNKFLEARLNRLLQKELSPQDLRLVILDYAEAMLAHNQAFILPEHLFAIVKSLDLDEYERQLLILVSGSPVKFEAVLAQSRKYSFMGLLRLLALIIAGETDLKAKMSVKKQFLFLLETLNSFSKATLLKKWRSVLQAGAGHAQDQELIKIQIHQCHLHIGENTYSLERKKTAVAILTLFKGRSSVPLSEIMPVLGCLDLDDSAINRLRVAIQRLNGELSKMTGITKSLRIKATTVDLTSFAVE